MFSKSIANGRQQGGRLPGMAGYRVNPSMLEISDASDAKHVADASLSATDRTLLSMISLIWTLYVYRYTTSHRTEMAQVFTFGFSSDDIDDGDGDTHGNRHPVPVEQAERLGNPPKLHNMDELLYSLPSIFSYTTIDLPISTTGSTISLPRRELFDIRAQLMAEDTGLDPALTEGLSTNDVTPNVYEGGFKTWECSVDLAKYVVRCLNVTSDTLRKAWHFIELGAGTALPTTVVFFLLLSRTQSTSTLPVYLTLCDYNASVLSLATLPNILLVWASIFHPTLFSAKNGELDITHSLLTSFTSHLSSRDIHISFISGPWSQDLVSLISSGRSLPLHSPSSSKQESCEAVETLILASETVYSPASIRAFTSVVLSLLSTSSTNHEHQRCQALVAAKKFYFGVGGGIDDFLRVLEDMTGAGRLVWDSDVEEGGGIGRCIVEVTNGTSTSRS